MSVVHYKPGDPGFDELVKKITPLSRIRKGHSHESTYIDAEPDNSSRSRKTRRETVDRL